MTTDTTIFFPTGGAVAVHLDESQCKLSLDFCERGDGTPGPGRPECGVSIICAEPDELRKLAAAFQVAAQLLQNEAATIEADRQ